MLKTLIFVTTTALCVTSILSTGSELMTFETITVDGAGRSTYYLSNFEATWTQADDFCQTLLGLKLVSIQNSAKNAEIRSIINNSTVMHFWTSGKICNSNLVWMSTNQVATYSDWYEGSGVRLGYFPCILLREGTSRTWMNNECSLKFNFICE